MSRLLNALLRYFPMVVGLLVAATLQAQVRYGQPETECFNRRQYGGGMQSWGVTQTANGMLYFANNDGLLEYDGTFWHLYNTPTGHIVRSVLAASDRIYVGQYHRVGYFSRSESHTLTYTSVHLPDTLSLIEDVWGLCEYDGRIFAQAQQAILEIDNDSVVRVHKPDDSHFFAIYVVDGDLIACDVERGLLLYNNGRFRELAEARELRGQYVTFAVPLAGVGVVLGTRTSGLWVMRNGGIERWDVEASDYAVRNELFCGIKLQDEMIALGTIRGGVVVVSSDGKIKTIVDRDKGLANNTVLGLGRDSEGNLWAALDNGIARLALGSNITLLHKAYNIGSGYAAAVMNGVCYFGTNQGLFAISDDKLRRADKSAADFKLVEGLVGQVWNLTCIGDNLFCAHDKGAFVIDKTGKPRKVTPAGERGVWGFCQINDSTVLCNSYYGLMRLVQRRGVWHWAGRLEGFGEGALYMAKEGNNTLWLTYGNEAIYRLTLSVDHSRIVHLDNLTNTFFSYDDKIYGAKVGSRVLFTSRKGVFTYNEARSTFESVDEVCNLFSADKMPRKVMADEVGRMWYFGDGDMGIIERAPDGSLVRNKAPFGSLTRCLVNGYESVCSTDSLNTFIAVEDGFAHYVHGREMRGSAPLDVNIRRLYNVGTDCVYEILNADSLRHFEYDFAHNSLVVEYAVCGFAHQNVEFSTMLEGYDNTWTDWTHNTKRELGNIYEGDYTLRVKARQADGTEGKELCVGITVHPPFYRSTFMKVLYALVLLGVVALCWWVLKRRERLVKIRQMEKEREELAKEKERLRIRAVEQEAELIKLRNRNLEDDKERKEKELTNQAFQLAKANELLSDTRDMLVEMRRQQSKISISETRERISSAITVIQRGLDDVSRMQLFEVHFETVHKEFFAHLSNVYPALSRNDMKVCAFIRMGMSSKEIASVLQITVHSVENARSAIRQKLGLGRENMKEFLQGICVEPVHDADTPAEAPDKPSNTLDVGG